MTAVLTFCAESPDGVVPAKVTRQRHPRAGGDPVSLVTKRRWIPAFAGMTPVVMRLALLLVAAPVAADAADLPKRKSGLWEISTSQPGGPPGPIAQMCIDEKTDDLTRQLAAGSVTCSKQDIRREGDRYVAESVCRIGDSTATTRAVFSGKFDSAYQADIEAKYSPPLMGMSEGRSTVGARWLGPCRAGQRPGDITMPNGTVINLYDAPSGAPKK